MTSTPPVTERTGAVPAPTDAEEAPASSFAGRLTSWPVLVFLCLYLLATGRWGSYVTVPGAAFYIGDIGIALVVVQVALAAATGRIPRGRLQQLTLVMLMVVALLGYTVLRLVTQLELSVVGLRDVAPYAYAVGAVLAFLLPARDHALWRPAIYTALVFHLVWATALKHAPGYPWDLPVLGTDARIFVIRPDFDAAILGVGAAFALWELLVRRPTRRLHLVLLIVFVAASLYGMVEISTRAGLFAGLGSLVAVALTRGHNLRPQGMRNRRLPAAVVAVAIALGSLAFVGAVAVTPAGSRVVESFTGGDGAGTISARQAVWSRIGSYVLADPERTAVGVGFGRDFIEESGAAASLEGIYQNVRSPHNYVLGTLARLGVAGALLVSVIIGLGWWLGVTALRRSPAPVDLLAALLVISIPITALLGVVLESPFGAIVYFWALGQLAAFSVPAAGTRESETVKLPTSSRTSE